jgi:hypothetical protein
MRPVPELFDLAAPEHVAGPGLPTIDTPLGRFALTARIEPRMSRAIAVHLFARDVDLFIWDDPAVRVELRVSHPDLELPDGMSVSHARAAVWRIRARRPLTAAQLSCELPSAGSTKSSPETGQGLECLTWEAKDFRLSLGTPDAEALLHFARDGAPLPDSWTAAWQDADTGMIRLVEYRPEGLRVILPPLAEGELAQTHFVVAWAPAGPASEATWWAVDQSPHVLLRHREPAV